MTVQIVLQERGASWHWEVIVAEGTLLAGDEPTREAAVTYAVLAAEDVLNGEAE